jgi:dihydrofolate synthase/folylpolyglutamate synthase
MNAQTKYQAQLQRLYGLASSGMRLGLDAVEQALERLGHPEMSLGRCVQITGTNGKGTTSAAIAHGARACGLRVGLFTSPHLHRFTERIRLDGREVEHEVLEPALRTVLDLSEAEGLPLTFFEVATLAALLVFAQQRLDLCVLEVGIGGRLDATSVVPKKVAVLTTVGFDHTEILGGTLAEIASEKAAIARPGVPFVVGSLPAEALAVARKIAMEKGALLRVFGEDFFVPEELPEPITGDHMRHNLALAVEALRLLSLGDERICLDRAVSALHTLRWPGRMEHLPGAPALLLDGAHNLEGIEALVHTLEQKSIRPSCALFGAVSGKPASKMLSALRAWVPQIVLAPPPLPRAIDCNDLRQPGDLVARDIEQGLGMAKQLAGPQGLVLVAGSLFTVAEARRLALKEPADPPVRL